MLLNCGVGEVSWESLEQQRDQTSQSQRTSFLNIHWKDWCWSWNSNTLAIWCKEPTQWKRPWCWESLRAGGKRGNMGWDGLVISLTQGMWVWANSRRWWWTAEPGVLQSTRCQTVRHDWLNNNNKFEQTIFGWKNYTFHLVSLRHLKNIKKLLFMISLVPFNNRD